MRAKTDGLERFFEIPVAVGREPSGIPWPARTGGLAPIRFTVLENALAWRVLSHLLHCLPYSCGVAVRCFPKRLQRLFAVEQVDVFPEEDSMFSLAAHHLAPINIQDGVVARQHRAVEVRIREEFLLVSLAGKQVSTPSVDGSELRVT